MIQKVQDIEIPGHVFVRAKYALIDYIGVTLAGSSENDAKIRSLLESFCTGEGSIFPVGIAQGMSMNDAVFLNGLNSHALDFDDGTNAGIIHLGSPLFSVLLPLAQKYEIDGSKLLRSAVFGYETSFTMAMTIQPVHKQRGYHATGTCGILGIAVAASYALGSDPHHTKRAFSTAAVSSSGTLKVLEDGSQLKPYNVAKTALLGITSVQMANAGFEVADDPLSGTAGFLSQMYGTDDIEFAPALLNGTYAIEKAYIKPYAACRYTHPAIDIAKRLRNEIQLSADEIENIIIRTYSLAVNKHDHIYIQGAASAKMSIPYNFAVTYATGKTGMDAFSDECLENAEIREFTKKVIVNEDTEMSAFFPEKTIASVVITARDGRRFEGRSELPKGEPENPLTPEEIIDKFSRLAVYGGKTKLQAEEIADAVIHAETKLPKLLSLLR